MTAMYCEEPDKNKQVYLNNLKEFAGGGILTAAPICSSISSYRGSKIQHATLDIAGGPIGIAAGCRGCSQ